MQVVSEVALKLYTGEMESIKKVLSYLIIILPFVRFRLTIGSVVATTTATTIFGSPHHNNVVVVVAGPMIMTIYDLAIASSVGHREEEEKKDNIGTVRLGRRMMMMIKIIGVIVIATSH